MRTTGRVCSGPRAAINCIPLFKVPRSTNRMHGTSSDHVLRQPPTPTTEYHVYRFAHACGRGGVPASGMQAWEESSPHGRGAWLTQDEGGAAAGGLHDLGGGYVASCDGGGGHVDVSVEAQGGVGHGAGDLATCRPQRQCYRACKQRVPTSTYTLAPCMRTTYIVHTCKHS